MATSTSPARPWGSLAVRGVIVVVFGLTILLWPDVTLNVLITLFGGYAVISGAIALYGAMRSAERQAGWWSQALQGVLGIVIGIAVFVWPMTTAMVLLFFIAIWAVITGLPEIAAAAQNRDTLEAASGGVLLVFAVILLVSPRGGAVSNAWLLGIFALVYGGITLARAWKLHAAA